VKSAELPETSVSGSCLLTCGSCRFFVIARSEATKQSQLKRLRLLRCARNDSISPPVSEWLQILPIAGGATDLSSLRSVLGVGSGGALTWLRQVSDTQDRTFAIC
jgi:hypothetical protein